MRFLIPLSIILLNSFYAFSQSPILSVTVSSDSVLLGNVILVSFSLENIGGDDIVFPDFSGFNQVGGPNVSTSMRITNGAVSQSSSYTFYLEPLKVGDTYIEPAGLETDEGYLETLPHLIKVYPNPDGIIQQPNNQPSLFGDDIFNISPFRNVDPFFDGGVFDDFFKNAPPMQKDTLAQQPKKRKTTRI